MALEKLVSIANERLTEERRANDARLADERNNYPSERKWMIGTYVGPVIAVVGILGIVSSFVSPVLK